MRTGQILGGVWLVGLNAFAFASVVRPLLRDAPMPPLSRSPVARSSRPG